MSSRLSHHHYHPPPPPKRPTIPKLGNLVELLAVISPRNEYDMFALGLLHALHLLIKKRPKCINVSVLIDPIHALNFLVVSLHTISDGTRISKIYNAQRATRSYQAIVTHLVGTIREPLHSYPPKAWYPGHIQVLQGWDPAQHSVYFVERQTRAV